MMKKEHPWQFQIQDIHEKYCAARLKTNNTHIIQPFDTFDEALAFIKTLLDDWDYSKGIPVICKRHSRNLTDDEKLWLTPYTEEILWDYIDLEKYELYYQWKQNRRKEAQKKRRKERNKVIDTNGDLETS